MFGMGTHSHEQSAVSLTSFGEFIHRNGVPLYFCFILIKYQDLYVAPFCSFHRGSLRCHPRLQFTVKKCQPWLYMFFSLLLLTCSAYSVETCMFRAITFWYVCSSYADVGYHLQLPLNARVCIATVFFKVLCDLVIIAGMFYNLLSNRTQVRRYVPAKRYKMLLLCLLLVSR